MATMNATQPPVTPAWALGYSSQFGQPVSEWHMLTASWNNGTATFYRDGAPLGTPVSMGGVMQPGTHLVIGTRSAPGDDSNTGANHFRGKLDEIAIFGSALSAADVTAIYNASLVPEPSTVVLLVTGLIGLLCYAWKKRR
ncbi:MAG: LamG domain-containing protein [Planctomycetales bacterium]|nr:LamG domain-containing protein [Planctomycetales bacterium]